MEFDFIGIIRIDMHATIVPESSVEMQKIFEHRVVESIAACRQSTFSFLDKLTYQVNGLRRH